MKRKTTAPVRPHIGLAVSGGADSLALLVLSVEALVEGNIDTRKLIVLHVDHGLRKDSADDARFVKRMAKKYGVHCSVCTTRVRKRKGESIEMAARRVRLDFFAKETKRLGLECIMTGHTKDDVVETFIMRLARGSGADGLAGIKNVSFVNGITFRRPLLGWTHEGTKAYLEKQGIAWREDSTNSDTSILRNKVRHVIIPFLRENLDPNITDHIAKSAAILRGDLEKPRPTDLTPPSEPEVKTYDLIISESTGYSKTNTPFTCAMSRKALAGRKLLIRTWQPGDRMQPIGLKGHSRKLHDIFVTAKIPAEQRYELPILVDAKTNEVLWLAGYRIAESVAVESPTAPSWRFELKPGK